MEDEDTLRRLAREYLEKQGYNVVDAADGAMALQIAVAHEGVVHLLLTDVIMPGMNGRELAQRMLEIRPNVKVLYMSGYTENVIAHNGTLDAGVSLLQKPFNLRDLRDRVREVLDSTPIPREVAMYSICLCVIAGSAKRTGTRAQPKTSAAPACSSKQKNCCSPVRSWKSTWCCQQKLPASQRRKLFVAVKSCVTFNRRVMR